MCFLYDMLTLWQVHRFHTDDQMISHLAAKCVSTYVSYQLHTSVRVEVVWAWHDRGFHSYLIYIILVVAIGYICLFSNLPPDPVECVIETFLVKCSGLPVLCADLLLQNFRGKSTKSGNKHVCRHFRTDPLAKNWIRACGLSSVSLKDFLKTQKKVKWVSVECMSPVAVG